jgi:hypothetical protein
LLVFHRPFVLVGALTAGDFVLWNWSLSASNDVLALIAGLTLLPLAATCLLLFALAGLQLASRLSRSSALSTVLRWAVTRPRPATRLVGRSADHRDWTRARRSVDARAITARAESTDAELVGAPATPAAKPARKLAA